MELGAVADVVLSCAGCVELSTSSADGTVRLPEFRCAAVAGRRSAVKDVYAPPELCAAVAPDGLRGARLRSRLRASVNADRICDVGSAEFAPAVRANQTQTIRLRPIRLRRIRRLRRTCAGVRGLGERHCGRAGECNPDAQGHRQRADAPDVLSCIHRRSPISAPSSTTKSSRAFDGASPSRALLQFRRIWPRYYLLCSRPPGSSNSPSTAVAILCAMAADIVPIRLGLTKGDLYTLWAPRWRDEGDEWEAFLGKDDDLYAFETVADLVAFVRTNKDNDLTDHPAWESSPRPTPTGWIPPTNGSTTSSAFRSWPPRSPATRRCRSCIGRWPSHRPSVRCVNSRRSASSSTAIRGSASWAAGSTRSQAAWAGSGGPRSSRRSVAAGTTSSMPSTSSSAPPTSMRPLRRRPPTSWQKTPRNSKRRSSRTSTRPAR